MESTEPAPATDLETRVAEIVTSYLTKNQVAPTDLPTLITPIFRTFFAEFDINTSCNYLFLKSSCTMSLMPGPKPTKRWLREDHHVALGDGRPFRRSGRVDCAFIRRLLEGTRIDVSAENAQRRTGPAQRERQRSADESHPNDSEALQNGHRFLVHCSRVFWRKKTYDRSAILDSADKARGRGRIGR